MVLYEDLKAVDKDLNTAFRKIIGFFEKEIEPLHLRDRIREVMDMCERAIIPEGLSPDAKEYIWETLEETKEVLLDIAKAMNKIEEGIRDLSYDVDRLNYLLEEKKRVFEVIRLFRRE